MNKNKIKKFAISARTTLIEKVATRAALFGVTEKTTDFDPNAVAVGGRMLTQTERGQRDGLIAKIKRDGYTETMEEAAYTWFNRFIALRYMEVNGYLPTHVRVFTDAEGHFNPQILTEALSLAEIDPEHFDLDTIIAFKEVSDDEGLYKYLLIAQCNALNEPLPGMFQKIGDVTELLFPDNLLQNDSVIAHMVADIDEADWQDQVQIVGWLYQFYNTEPKHQVIDINKSAVKKQDIPAATQLFTTDWVVRYIVDNTLGRYWLERNPDSSLADTLTYLVKPKDGTFPHVDEAIEPQDLTVFDPCVGSGHFLEYAFDVLMQIYTERGYSARDAAKSIVENNLYGLDIDNRASQLAYFSVMMKARQYDRRFFRRNVCPHVSVFTDAQPLSNQEFINKLDDSQETAEKLLSAFSDAKEIGSMMSLDITASDLDNLEEKLSQLESEYEKSSFVELSINRELISKLRPLIQVARILIQTYSVVVTNPPYLNKYNPTLKKFVNGHYKDFGKDLFSVFMYRNFFFCKEDGYTGFMTPFVWMFIASYEKLRTYILKNKDITTLIQMEYSAFEEATVPICTFVLKNGKQDGKGLYFRLSDFAGGMDVQNEKVLEAIANPDCGYFYEADSKNFSKIPGSPIAYWVSKQFINAFNHQLLSDLGEAKSGLQTGNNAVFLKLWFELNINKIKFNAKNKKDFLESQKKWTPQIKGGSYRKWYGNFDYVVNWEDDGLEIKKCPGCRLNAMGRDDLFFKKGITWSHTTSSVFGARFLPVGHLFNVEAPTYFCKDNSQEFFILGFLNSNIAQFYLSVMNSTLHYLVGNILELPVIESDNNWNINTIVQENINLSKSDWDAFETSWDFEKHPLMQAVSKIADAYAYMKRDFNAKFDNLKANEEALNRIFIDIYGLQDELTPEESDKDVTVHKIFDTKADVPDAMKNSNYALTKQDVIKSFISYAVGCMLGRYSIDADGLAYAGGVWDSSQYKRFVPDDDGIVPITDADYFDDDAFTRFEDFVRIVYGENTLEENLIFIADALSGGKKTSRDAREVIRDYFLKDFFKDHAKTYSVTGSGKRPIYWLFDAGKQNSFKALIYIHRYRPDTIARLRTKYIHPMQEKLRTLHSQLKAQDDVPSRKKAEKLDAKLTELAAYEEKIKHYADMNIEIDLDDGVKVNHAKFGDILAKI